MTVVGETLRLNAALFDLGGTLIKTAEVPEIFRRILEAHGVKADCSRILEAHKVNEKGFDIAAGTVESGMAFWNNWNLAIINSLGIEKDAQFLAGKITELWWEYADLQFHSDVLDTLAELKAKKVKIGIVTNGLRADYERALHMLEAGECFEVTVGVDSCGSAKPDRRIFLYAVEKLQLKPPQVLFVGDSVEKDYEGAKRAGLKSLLIDREGKASPNVESIRTLAEVLLYF